MTQSERLIYDYIKANGASSVYEVSKNLRIKKSKIYSVLGTNVYTKKKAGRVYEYSLNHYYSPEYKALPRHSELHQYFYGLI